MFARLGHQDLAELPQDARLVLLAVRAWTCLARRRDADDSALRARAVAALRAFLERAGVEAGQHLDALLALLGRHARRPVWLGCPGCGAVSAGERRLLQVCAAALAGEVAACRRHLAFWLEGERLEEAVGLALALAVRLAEAGMRPAATADGDGLPRLDLHSLIENAPRIRPPRVAPGRALA